MYEIWSLGHKPFEDLDGKEVSYLRPHILINKVYIRSCYLCMNQLCS